MQVSVEATTGLERQMTVTVPAARIDEEVASRVQQTARTARIDGFRPGKVPLKVIKKRYGAGIREEVLGGVVQQSFYEAAVSEKLQPAGTPSISFTTNTEGEDVVFVATFETFPEIELADYSAAEVTRQAAEVTDADIDNMIETLRKQQATWTEVEREAGEGDQVKMDFEGFIDGEAFEGGKGEGMDLVLGSGQMIPGFEDGLTGIKAGEEREINVTFPEEYHAENLKGKDATFKIKAIAVSEQVLAELNEDFFKGFGIEGKDLEGFKEDVRGNMERELKQATKAKLKDQVFSQLIALNAIEVPNAMVDSEIDTLRRQAISQYMGDQAADVDINMLPKEMYADQAKRRVTIGLLIQELIKANDIKVDAERVDAMIVEMSETYQDPQQVVEYYQNNKEMRGQIENLVLEDQVVDYLLATAKVTDETVSYEEAMKPAPAPQAEAAEEAAE